MKEKAFFWVAERVDIAWHMGLLAASAWVSQNPKYSWLAPVLQAYGQISAPPGTVKP